MCLFSLNSLLSGYCNRFRFEVHIFKQNTAKQHTSKVFSSDVNCGFANGQMVFSWMYAYSMSVHWWCGWLGLSGMIGMTFSVKKWRKSRFQKTWMMPKLWEPSSPNTKTLTTPKCWWPTSQHMFCILLEREGKNISVLSLSTCCCFFCILDMLRTNLHPFTLISLFYVIAGQSQAQIQNKRTQQRSPF